MCASSVESVRLFFVRPLVSSLSFVSHGTRIDTRVTSKEILYAHGHLCSAKNLQTMEQVARQRARIPLRLCIRCPASQEEIAGAQPSEVHINVDIRTSVSLASGCGTLTQVKRIVLPRRDKKVSGLHGQQKRLFFSSPAWRRYDENYSGSIAPEGCCHRKPREDARTVKHSLAR